MADTVYMLTTIDNPFSPFTQYEEWYKYDVLHGHNTCAYLARIAKASDELSDADQSDAIEQAMNEIVGYNLSGLHLKVSEDYVPRVQYVGTK
jgi:hypothetical protein